MLKRLLNLFTPKATQEQHSSHGDTTGVEQSSIRTPNPTITRQSLTDEEIHHFLQDEINYRLNGPKEIHIGRLDPLLKDAALLIVTYQQGSTSLIQRKLKLGYNRAGAIIDQLEALGIVGPFEGSKAREVLLDNESQIDMVINGKYGVKTEKRKFFEQYILPSKLDLIEQEVSLAIHIKEQAQIQHVKAQIREELLLKENQKKEQRRLEELRQQVFNEMLDKGEIEAQTLIMSREPISQAVKDMVWNRDGGRCVVCGSNQKLEFDHIIPFAKGGSNTYRNIQLLCEGCNRAKSAKIG